MRVEDNVRKCVAFVALRMRDETYRFVGSAFWLGRDVPGQIHTAETYLVTARHVIEEIAKTGVDEVWLRVNKNDGSSAWGSTKISQWYMHPSDPSLDVAIIEMGVPVEGDHLVLPYSLCLTPELAATHEMAVGEEIFIVGLFKHYYGEQRNIPIVRIGNLATAEEQKISSERFGKRDAYLIEARSIGGLSGSPAFLNFGATRVIRGQLVHAQAPIVLLMGLVSGHYDVHSAGVDAATTQSDRVNTGIAVVVPIRNVRAVIESYEREREGSKLQTPSTPAAPKLA
jgi:hypothetical protein